jgi:hypothetical protein
LLPHGFGKDGPQSLREMFAMALCSRRRLV